MGMPNQIGLSIFPDVNGMKRPPEKFLFKDYDSEVECRKAVEKRMGELVAESAPKYDAHVGIQPLWNN